MSAACLGNNPSVLKILFDLGVDIDHKGGVCGLTPFLWSCTRGFSKVLGKLAELGANVHVVSTDGRNALAIAATFGRISLFAQLVSLGVEINGRDKAGATALMCAATEGRVDSVQKLVELGGTWDVTLANAMRSCWQRHAARDSCQASRRRPRHERELRGCGGDNTSDDGIPHGPN